MREDRETETKLPTRNSRFGQEVEGQIEIGQSSEREDQASQIVDSLQRHD